ncbi:MAG TPA: adenylate/guanylate cyclase domain-containing protein [Casimicrobiaceae bacterium]
MPSDIDEWLEGLGLAKYAARFADNEVDLEVLPDLTEEDLKGLDIPLGPRKKLLKAIAALAGDARAPDQPDGMQAGDARAIGQPTDIHAADAPAIGQPAAIHAGAQPRRNDGERRQLSVMFCDLVDSTALAARIDPEDLRDVIRDYHDMCANVVARYGGYVAKYLGDGVLVYFGYPQAHENDPERAVRGGLAILDAIAAVGSDNRALDAPLAVRVGIDTGPVVVGDMAGEGPAERANVVGETPNVASRLQALAQPNQVVVGPLARELIGEAFACEDLGLQRLKGMAEPLHAWRVVRERDIAGLGRARGTDASQLVGRQEELGLLIRSWEASRNGHGQVVLIQGEAGIGKSRLVTALRAQAERDEYVWVATRCSPYHTSTSLHPVVEHLKRVIGWTPGDGSEERLAKLESALATQSFLPTERAVPLYAALLALPLPAGRYAPLELDPEEQREQTLDALVGWLLEEAERKPVLRVWEDVQWADPTTLALLELCIAQSPTVAMMNVVTHRPDFVPRWTTRSHMTPISLGRLERPEVEALIMQRAGGRAMPAEVVEYVLDKTDGVPLYVEELTKAIVEANFVRDREHGYELVRPLSDVAIPATLQDLLMARLDRLPSIREVAQLGSILGREFAYEMLQAIASLEETALQSGLDQLVDAELLYQRGRRPRAKYIFKHALVHDAAYQSLLRRTRQYYHRQVAELLENRYPEIVRTQPELLAHHYARADAHAKSVQYLTRCAENAAGICAHEEAIAGIEQARMHAEHLPAAERDRRVLALVIRQAHSMHFLGRREEIVALLLAHRERLERIGEPALAGEFHFWLGFAHGWLGHRAQAAEALHRSLEEASTAGDEAIMGRVHRALATECIYSGQPLDEAIAHARDAATLLTRANDRFWLSQALFTLSYCCIFAGDFDGALGAASELAAFGAATGIARAKANATMLAGLGRAMRGEGEAAVALCEEALDVSPDRFESAFILACLGRACCETGDTVRAVAMLEQAVELADQVRSLQFRAWFRTMLGEAYALHGEVAKTDKVVGEALEISESTGFLLGIALAKQALGRSAWMLRDGARAARYLDEAIVIFVAIGARFELARAQLARAAVAVEDGGDRDAARARIRDARALFASLGAPRYVEHAERLRDRLDS